MNEGRIEGEQGVNKNGLSSWTIYKIHKMCFICINNKKKDRGRTISTKAKYP